jgi:hypothetical protein
MQKRLLAILAIVATVFAFGVGSALAKPGPPNPHPACDTPNAPSWCDGYDGQPGDRDGETEPDPVEPDPDEDGEGDDPAGPLQPLCDGLAQVAEELGDACEQVFGAIFGAAGGGEEEPPADDPPADDPPADDPPADDPEGRPAPCDEFEQIPEIGTPVADGCAQLLGALPLPGGEEEPPADEDPVEEEPPADEDPAGPGCADLNQLPEIGAPLAEGCQTLVDNLPAP